MASCPIASKRRQRLSWPLGVAAVLSLPVTAAAAQLPDHQRALAEIRQRECGEPIGELTRLGFSSCREYPGPIQDPPESRERLAQAFLDLAACYNPIGPVDFSLAKGVFGESRHCARAAVDLAQTPEQRISAHNALGPSVLGSCQPGCLVDTPWEGVNRVNRQLGEEGEAAFREVLELTGGRGNAVRVSLGELLALQGRHAEAVATFADYLEREPEGEHVARARRGMKCAALRPIPLPRTVPLPRGLRPPVNTFSPNPRYTRAARRARIQGVAFFEATIDTTGALRCVKVLRGLPEGLTGAAVDTLLTWRYEPATLDGEPVAVTTNLTVRFSLR